MAFVSDAEQHKVNLVFDLGFHKGEDTGYYLAMGRRVVALEANKELVDQGKIRFAKAVADGRLVLIHAAVVGDHQSRRFKQLAFYPHPQRSEWGSVDLRWVRRNKEAHGLPHGEPLLVSTMSLPQLVQIYGCPSFLKIDIEGADEDVLSDLSMLTILPPTVSWETGKESLRAVLRQHSSLARLGYGKFRVVQQAFIECCAPVLSVDGSSWQFEPGCSGELPELSPRRWRSLMWVQSQYCLLFFVYILVGPRSFLRAQVAASNPFVNAIPRAIFAWSSRLHFPLPGWFDTHASLS